MVVCRHLEGLMSELLAEKSNVSQGGASSVAGLILNIMRYSTQDGPGLRTTVFLKGCPLRCSWCHNPESQSFGRQLYFRKDRCIECGECLKCSEGGAVGPGVYDDLADEMLDDILEACTTEARSVYGRRRTAAEVMAEVEKDLPFFEQSGGGVTFSGGEPFAQPQFLEELLAEAVSRDINVAVDTCGQAPWELIDRLRESIDLFLYDLKIMDDDLHKRETGVSNKTILDNLEKLSAAGENILIRVPIIPSINDDEENIRELSEFVNSLAGDHTVQILPYHETGTGKYDLLEKKYATGQVSRPDHGKMEKIARVIKSHGIKVLMGGTSNDE